MGGESGGWSDMTANAVFYLKQVVLFGSAGFVAFVAASWWPRGPFWSSDIWQVWLTALLVVGMYLLIVGAPIQLALRRFHMQRLALLLGLISGPSAVLIYQLFFFDD